MNYWPHHQEGPWRDAPSWALEIREMLRVIINREGDIMSQTDDLVAGVTALATSVTTLTDNTAAHDAAVQKELEALKAALAGTTSDPAVAQAIANIAALSTSVASSAATIKTETDALVASLPPPSPPPAPAPAPAPAA